MKTIINCLCLCQVWGQTTGSGWAQPRECETFNSSSDVETDREQSDIRSGVMAWNRAVNICELMKQSL